MLLFTDPNEVQKHCLRERCAGKKIGLVPTMGCFHAGHISLMRRAAEQSDLLAVSLFVNPVQFGPDEDLDAYPRSLERDMDLAEKEGVDIFFTPADTDMYPPGYCTQVSVPGPSANLCGINRPGHFNGVATVVAKLFNIFCPHLAVFGRKDWQQLAVIRRMVRDLDFPLEIIGQAIIREPDGLAMSSRNSYLDSKKRSQAAQIYAGLKEVRRLFEQGERKADDLIACFCRHAKRNIPDGVLQYAKIVDPDEIFDLKRIEHSGLMAVAVRIGQARLIDNILLEEH